MVTSKRTSDKATSTKRAFNEMMNEIVASKNAHESLLREIDDALMFVSDDGKTLWGNDKACRWLGVHSDLVQKQYLKKMFDTDNWTAFNNYLSKILSREILSSKFLSECIISNSKREISWNMKRFENGGRGLNEIVLVSGRDITEEMLLTREKAKLDLEMQTVKIIQKHFLPPNKILSEKIDILSYYQEAEHCSGDWWTYAQIGEYVLICIADVTGHGPAPAMITGMLHSFTLSYLHSPILSKSQPRLVDLAEMLNANLFRTFRGEETLTFFGVLIDTRDLSYNAVIAGHNYPQVLKPNGKLIRVGHPDFQCESLGRDLDTEFNLFTGVFEKGDKLLLFTDGIFECKNLDGNQLGSTRFLKSFANKSSLNSEDLRDTTIDFVFDFMGQDSHDDDLTFLVIDFK